MPETKPRPKTRGPYKISPNDGRYGKKKDKLAVAKVRKTRTRTAKTNRLAGRPPGVFYEDLVGVVIGYPKTEELFKLRQIKSRAAMLKQQAEGKMGRGGVPDGWGGSGDQLAEIRLNLFNEAEGLIKIMVDEGIVPDDKAANSALQFAVSVVQSKIVDGKEVFAARDRLAAARLVLDFTRAKPAQKSEVTLSSAEDFLSALAAKSGG